MTAKIKVPENVIGDVARTWNRMNPRERLAAVHEVAAEHEVSIGTVYRRLKSHRKNGSRIGISRSDRGRPRILSDEEMREYVGKIMGLKSYDPYKPDKRLSNHNKAMSTARAIEILEKTGDIPPDILTVRTVNRWATVYHSTAGDICAPTPAVKLVTEHPNHVHVIDFSVCEQYYLRDSDGKVLSRPWTYKNKPNESRQKIWAFALVDHYSNVKFIKYFLSHGESSRILFKGLMEAWSKKDDSQFPFHGAPRYVYADRGSALKSTKIQNLLSALNIKSLEHKPGNPRAKGMVETAFGQLQRNFETDLRVCPASSIEELNERVYNWLVKHNWSAKTDGSIPRFQRWQEITREQLLELPEMHILRRVTASDDIRTVDAYCTISLGGEKYGVPEELLCRKVRVWHNIDGGLAVQDMETGEMYPTVEPKTTVFGQYNAHKKSAAERMHDRAINMAHEISKRITPDDLRRDVPNMYAIPRSGKPIDVDNDLVQVESEEYASIYQAKKAIADELRINLGDLPDWMVKEIETVLMKILDKKTVSEIARFIGSVLNESKSAV